MSSAVARSMSRAEHTFRLLEEAWFLVRRTPEVNAGGGDRLLDRMDAAWWALTPVEQDRIEADNRAADARGELLPGE